MSNIKKFDQFINEDYSLRGMISGVGNWIKNLVSKIRGGKIKNIPASSDNQWKAGHPMVNYYSCSLGGGKSVEQQVEDSYGIKFESKNLEFDLDEAAKDYEDIEILKYPDKEAGVTNMHSTKLKDLIIKRFDSLVRGGYDKPIFIYGAPGIGKTEIVASVCDELCIDLITVDLQFMEPTDFLGIPSKDDIPPEFFTETDIEKRVGILSKLGKGLTRQNPPAWLPLDNGTPIEMVGSSGEKSKSDGPGGIIFFDEMNRANPPVIAAMMVLLQQRRIGTEYNLPTKWLIIAAGNRKEDDISGEINDLGTALINRCEIVNYVATPQEWVEFVKQSPKKLKGAFGKTPKEIVLPELITFMEFTKDYFYTLNSEKKGKIFASPRSWIDASKALYSEMEYLRRQGKNTIDKQDLIDIFARNVGPEAANAFVEFYTISQNIKIEDVVKVFSDPKNAPPLERIGGQIKPDTAYQFISAIVDKSRQINPDGKLTAEQYGHAVDYSILMDSFEFATAFNSLLISKHPYITTSGIDYIKHIERFTDKYTPDK